MFLSSENEKKKKMLACVHLHCTLLNLFFDAPVCMNLKPMNLKPFVALKTTGDVIV